MKVRIATVLLSVVLGAFALACSKSLGPSTESNTNWLTVCTEGADCSDGASCYCGVCTKVCDADKECGDVAEGAECVAAADLGGACGADAPVEQLCALPCEAQSSCEAAAGDLSCQGGQCVREPSVDSDPSGSVQAMGPACLISSTVAEIAVQNLDRVDMLFVVDDSPSMAEEIGLLRDQLPRMMDALSGERADGAKVPKLSDLHLAVVTPDMGALGVEGLSGCQGAGDDGIFQHAPQPDLAGCADDYPPFIDYEFGNGATSSTVAQDLACTVPSATGTCAFRQPLEAMLKSLWPSVDIDPATGVQWVDPATGQPGNRITFLTDLDNDDPLGHGDRENAGFLHDSAADGLSLISVVLVTDGEDCSSTTTDHMLPADQLPSGHPLADSPMGLRCFLSGPNLYGPDRYIQGLQALRPGNENLVTFSAIVGVPTDLVHDASDDGIDWENPDARDPVYERILNDARMQETVDTSGERLMPSCISARGNAYPPRRIVEVARRFGANGVVASICEDDFEPALDQVLAIVQKQLGAVCLPRQLERLANGGVDCDVVWELPRAETAPATTPVECDQMPFLSPPRAGQATRTRDGRARCEVNQLVAMGSGADRAVEAGSGWYYDDFSESLAEECRGDNQQRIAFSDDASPPTGVTVQLDCLQQVVDEGASCEVSGSAANADEVGTTCLPATAPENGFDDREAYVEIGPSCGDNVCLVYELQGDPSDSCVPETCPAEEDCKSCASAAEVSERIYCSCRCGAPDDPGAEECDCPSGFTCEPVLRRGPASVVGSYCLRTSTVN